MTRTRCSNAVDLLTYCGGNGTNRQKRFSMDEKFVELLTIVRFCASIVLNFVEWLRGLST